MGLGVSVGLFAVSFLLIKKPSTSDIHTSLDTLGVLQLTWLYGKNPSIPELIRNTVEKPTTKSLRVAGNFEVNLAGDTREARGVYQCVGDRGAESLHHSKDSIDDDYMLTQLETRREKDERWKFSSSEDTLRVV